MMRSLTTFICLIFFTLQFQAQVTTVQDSVRLKDSVLVHDLNFVIPGAFFGDLNTVRPIEKPFPRHEYRTFWTKVNRFGLDLSEVAFVNWNSGGSNSISGLINTDIKRIYELDNLRWFNELILQYGINSQESQEVRKTNDNFEINSTLGYRSDTLSNWFYSAKLNFNTQISNGYNYPDTSKEISSIMAPGYLLIGGGVEYGEQMKALNVYASPLTLKSTFVLNQRLANEGSFGVEEAVRNDEGEIIEEGKKIRNEFGILITGEYNTTIYQNIAMANKLRLYTDYINNFGNIDVDWQLDVNFQVNQYVKAKIGSHLKYDDDIKIQRTNSEGELISSGPKVQWKQQLGVGVLIEI